jgi:hypothetical protein
LEKISNLPALGQAFSLDEHYKIYGVCQCLLAIFRLLRPEAPLVEAFFGLF